MKFTQTHEWINVTSDIGVIGVTNFARNELGDIVYVELPEIGAEVNAGAEVAVLESTKAASDIYSPVSGKIIEVNNVLSDDTDSINESPEDKGWIFKIQLSNQSELSSLMDRELYESTIK